MQCYLTKDHTCYGVYLVRGCKVRSLIDKKTAVILALLVLVAITGVGWFSVRSKPERGGSLPEEIDNWTEYFHGYEAYLDREIHCSIVDSSSMMPTFGVGDLVLWVRVDNMAELKEGDIIVYKHPTRPYLDNIAHRIIEVEVVDGGYRFRTKGDNLSAPDQHSVPEANVYGLVIGVIYSAA